MTWVDWDNLYPSEGHNWPEASFPQEVQPPAVDPDEGTTILVAYNPFWSAVLASACDQLLQYSTWQGDHDAKLLAVERATNLKAQLQIPIEQKVPAPYWDDETDVEAEEPEATQEWYGEVVDANAAADSMTFQENAVIWLLTGFVAIAATPAAAIFFRTLASRFVLAIKRDDIGEIWRVIIDAKDYSTVDTSSNAPGDIVELPINGLDDASTHDILLVKVS